MQQEEELAKQLTLYPGKPRPAPGPPAAHVRLNAAAILREDTLYKRKQQQEAQMIKRHAFHARDNGCAALGFSLKTLPFFSSLKGVVTAPTLLSGVYQHCWLQLGTLAVAFLPN